MRKLPIADVRLMGLLKTVQDTALCLRKIIADAEDQVPPAEPMAEVEIRAGDTVRWQDGSISRAVFDGCIPTGGGVACLARPRYKHACPKCICLGHVGGRADGYFCSEPHGTPKENDGVPPNIILVFGTVGVPVVLSIAHHFDPRYSDTAWITALARAREWGLLPTEAKPAPRVWKLGDKARVAKPLRLDSGEGDSKHDRDLSGSVVTLRQRGCLAGTYFWNLSNGQTAWEANLDPVEEPKRPEPKFTVGQWGGKRGDGYWSSPIRKIEWAELTGCWIYIPERATIGILEADFVPRAPDYKFRFPAGAPWPGQSAKVVERPTCGDGTVKLQPECLALVPGTVFVVDEIHGCGIITRFYDANGNCAFAHNCIPVEAK